MAMTQTDKFEHAKSNAKGWYETIKEQLEALKGYDKAAKDAGWTPFKDKFNVLCWKDEADGSTWTGTAKNLCEAHDIDVEEDEDARCEIEEGILEVAVRDGWHSPGQPSQDGPEEFYILLTTGGPALRIYGTLGAHGEPDDCELQMQEWGTPWTKWAPEPYDEEYCDTLLAYARCFYFGE